MDVISWLYHSIDDGIILFYRLPENPLIGFYFGTTVLVWICILTGEALLILVYFWNQSHYEKQAAEFVRMHNLSVMAIQAGDKESYLAANRLANDSFGRIFFARASLFAVSLLPAPFALGWTASRFSELSIQLPLTNFRTNYATIFIILYIASRIFFSAVKRHLPLIGRIRTIMAESEKRAGKPLSWPDPSRKTTNIGDG